MSASALAAASPTLAPPPGAQFGDDAPVEDSLPGARDAEAREHVVLAWETARTERFVHEAIDVRLVIEVEERFLAEKLIAPVRQRLDVPLLLEVPGFDAAESRAEEAGAAESRAAATGVAQTGAAEVERARSSGAGAGGAPDARERGRTATLALNGRAVDALRLAPRERGGRRFAVFAVERTLRRHAPGALVLAAPLARLAWAASFADDPFRGRVPVDRRDAVVAGAPLELAIRPLPPDPPAAFCGAVGTFTLRAEATPRALAVGESVELTLHLEDEGSEGTGQEGGGWLDRLVPPRLDRLPGFALRGTLVERTARGRALRFDLAPRDARVTAVPPVELAWFDPTPPAGWRVERTAPLPIEVRGARAAARSSGADAAPEPGARAVLVGVAALGGAALVAALALVLLRRRRAATRPEHARAERALAAFRARLAQTDALPPASRGNAAAPSTPSGDSGDSASGVVGDSASGASGDSASGAPYAAAASGEVEERARGEALAAFLAVHLRTTSAAVIGPRLAERLATEGRLAPPLAARTAALLDALVNARYATGARGAAAPPDAGAVLALVAELDRAFRAGARTERPA